MAPLYEKTGRKDEALVWKKRPKAVKEALEAGHDAAKKAEWATARGHLEKARDLGGESTTPFELLDLAMVLYKLGDTAAYFETCESYAKRFGDSKDPRALRLASFMYFGLPSGPDAEVRRQVLAMARRSVELVHPAERAYLLGALALGLAEYRAGDPAAAVKWLEIAQWGTCFCPVRAHAYHALVAVRLGKPGEAAAQLKTAEEQFTEQAARASAHWSGIVASEMALEEARSTIRGNNSKE